VATTVTIPHTHVHRLTRHFLEPAQDILVLAIGLALFGLMVRTIGWLILQIFKPTLNFREVMAEVVRLLISYLKEHRVAVDFMVELGIVATLREIVLRGVTDLAWQQVLALTMFVIALGALLRFGDLRSPYAPVIRWNSTAAQSVRDANLGVPMAAWIVLFMGATRFGFVARAVPSRFDTLAGCGKTPSLNESPIRSSFWFRVPSSLRRIHPVN
jgi:uncharacterized membrane protein (DUF373 family)